MRKHRIILNYPTFANPFPGYEATNQAQVDLLEHIKDVAIACAMWLRYFELGQTEYYSAIQMYSWVRPLYDMSRARMTLCAAAYGVIDWVQEIAKNADEAWGYCEAGFYQNILLNAGFYGVFEERSTGKRNYQKRQSDVLNQLLEVANGKAVSVEEFFQKGAPTTIFDWASFENRLLASALEIAEKQDDDFLMSRCKLFLEHRKRHLNRSKNSDLYQIASISRGRLEFTGKGKKSRKAK